MHLLQLELLRLMWLSEKTPLLPHSQFSKLLIAAFTLAAVAQAAVVVITTLHMPILVGLVWRYKVAIRILG